jgi:DNA-binding response OmpR family regulator
VADRQDEAPPVRGARILIVEDELLLAMEIETMLRQQGYSVSGPAPTVARALALLDQDRPDAVILDLNLNGDPAIPVATALSARGIPFIIVSGYSAKEPSEPELQNAPRLDKPVNKRALLRAVSRAISG